MPATARPKGPLTWQEAKDQIDYDPLTGILTWKIRKPRIYPGRRAGGTRSSKKGYRQIEVCGYAYGEHLFIWFWMMGSWPPKGYQIDHINRIGSDNRWENLRLATREENQRNTIRYGRLRGIHKRKGAGGKIRYRVRIRERKNTYQVGVFDTEEEAIAAFDKAARAAYGEFYPDEP